MRMPTTRTLTRLAGTAVAAGALTAAGLAGSPSAHAEPIVTDPSMPTVETENFTVSNYSQERRDGYKIHDIEVCVTKPTAPGETVRVSWDPWTLHTQSGSFEPMSASTDDGDLLSTYPNGHQSGGGPNELFLENGECATGHLVFPDDLNRTEALSYASSWGDEVTWAYDS